MPKYPIKILVPANFAGYSGPAPVTFGVQFRKGQLKNSRYVRLTGESGYKRASFRVTALWDPPNIAPRSVRWLLVDTVVHISNGEPEKLQLVYGTSAPAEPSYNHLQLLQNDTSIPFLPAALPLKYPGLSVFLAHIMTNFQKLIGHFDIESAGNRYTLSITKHEWEVVTGVRCTAKLVGQYQSLQDDKPIAQATIRLIFWHGMAAVQIFHTLTWLRDDLREIDTLKLGRPVTTKPWCSAAGQGFYLTDTIRQVSFNGTNTDEHAFIDGWIQTTESPSSSQTPPCHISLRWAREEYPTSFGYDPVDHTVSIGLIDPDGTMSLDPGLGPPSPLAYSGFECTNPSAWEGDGDDWSPRGLAKTHELWLLWGHDPKESPTLHLLANEQVYALLEPVSAPKADLPSPWSAASPEFPELEDAICASFDFLTQQQDEFEDFGVWNHGDLQYAYIDYKSHLEPPQMPYEHEKRYWLNQGKGWAPVPWLLWLRSGNRKYIDNAVKHSRHVMDVDTCNIPESYATLSDYETSSGGKMRGGVYTYSNTHLAREPRCAHFVCDPAEHLALYWYMTGYERALEMLQTTMLSLNEQPTVSHIWDFFLPSIVDPPADQPTVIDRGEYNLIREAALLYECTWSPFTQLSSQAPHLSKILHSFVKAVIAGVIALQKSKGVAWFPGPYSAHWLSQPLLIARRVLGDAYTYSDGNEAITILEILKRWYRYQGDVDSLGSDGRCDGPESLWALTELYHATQDSSYLATAAKIATTRALCVASDAPGQLRGISGYQAQYAGPILRDAVAVIATLAALPPASRPTGLAASTYFHSGLPVHNLALPFKLHHVLFFKRCQPDEVKLLLHLTPFNFEEPKLIRVRVHEPSGETYVMHQVERLVTPTADKTWSSTEVFEMTLPSGGDAGVYAAEVLEYAPDSKGVWGIPVHARAFYGAVKSGGGDLPLVHYMPDVSSDDGSAISGKTVRNNSYGGQFFAKANSSGSIVVDPRYCMGGRAVLLQDGSILAMTQVAGTLGFHALTQIKADVAPGTVISIAYGDVRREAALTVRRVQPYYAGWKELLFIPEVSPLLADILNLPQPP